MGAGASTHRAALSPVALALMQPDDAKRAAALAAKSPSLTEEEIAERSALSGKYSTLSDPWHSVSDDDAVQILQDDEVELLQCPLPDGGLASAAAAAKETVLRADSSGTVFVSDDIGFSLVSSPALSKVVALDLSNCEFVSAPSFGPSWLRSLSLSGSSFSGSAVQMVETITFAGLHHLLRLDLSYCAWDSFGAAGVFKPLNALRHLSLDGCGLDSVPANLSALTGLETLTLTENEITSVEALGNLSSLGQSLLDLDLRDNEELSGHESTVCEMCPKLRRLDNKNLKTCGAGKRMDRLQLNNGAAASVADQNEDRGSCSCIEGNPCQSEYTCKDWKNRFKVAKHVREQSGIRT